MRENFWAEQTCGPEVCMAFLFLAGSRLSEKVRDTQEPSLGK